MIAPHNIRQHTGRKSRMVRSKHEIWKRSVYPYQPGGLCSEESTKSKYRKCSACDEPIIAISARLQDQDEEISHT